MRYPTLFPLDAAHVTVVVPTIPIRGALLARAVESVMAQTWKPGAISIAVDLNHKGHGPTRTRATMAATTEWICYLDDDDELLPQHLERLITCQRETQADLIYPWFHVQGGEDPWPERFGRPWDSANPNMIVPVTVLVRRQLVLDAGGFDAELDSDGRCWRAVAASGAKIVHHPEKTWIWHHDSGNTSGMPSRW